MRRHPDLLDVVADSSEEADAVRRILSEPLISPPRQNGLRACSRCDSGLTGCATPDACQISTEPDRPRPPPKPGDMVLIAFTLLAAWALIATLAVTL